jgi:hypothetical protein
VAVSGSTVQVVYADFRAGGDLPRIYTTRSLDSGVSWQIAVPLAEAFTSWYPSVAVSGSHVHAAWPDNRNGDVAEIYYKESQDGGATWAPEVRLTDDPSESREPSVAVSGTYVHVVWHDDRDQNWEIYQKRSALDSAGAGEGATTAGAAPRLLSAIPSPSSGEVVIRYHLPSTASGLLEIFDPSGALVRRVAQPSQPSGWNEIRWNGRDEAGRAVPSGVYMTRIEMDGRVTEGRIVLAR